MDNFLDDDLRDLGAAQTGAVVVGVLDLWPITASAQHAKGQREISLLTLDYTPTPVIEHYSARGSMKINPLPGLRSCTGPVMLNWPSTQFIRHQHHLASDVAERLIIRQRRARAGRRGSFGAGAGLLQ